MATKAAKRLFRSITTNPSLVLNRPLHKVKTTKYNLRLATKTLLEIPPCGNFSIGTNYHGLISNCASSTHALRMLRTHGLPPVQLQDVARMTTISFLLYDSPGWCGFTSAHDRGRLKGTKGTCQTVPSHLQRWPPRQLRDCSVLSPPTPVLYSTAPSIRLRPQDMICV